MSNTYHIGDGNICQLIILDFSIVIQAIPKHATVSSIELNNDLFCISSSTCRVGEDGPWDQTQYINTQSNLTTHQVTGLLPFTVYSFRLIANNELGPSPPSKESYYIVTLREGEYPELILRERPKVLLSL